MLTLCHQSKAFVVPKTETMCILFDYVIRPPTLKGFMFSSVFSISPNPNWTLFNLNQGFSSGSGKSLELNWWSSLGFGKNRLWTKLNQTFPSLACTVSRQKQTLSYIFMWSCKVQARILLMQVTSSYNPPSQICDKWWWWQKWQKV